MHLCQHMKKFETEQDALVYATNFADIHGLEKVQISAYKCMNCKQWHSSTTTPIYLEGKEVG